MVGSTGVGKVQSCVNYLFHTNASGIKVESSKQNEFVGQRSAVDYGKEDSKLCIYLTHTELDVLDVLWCSDMQVLL